MSERENFLVSYDVSRETAALFDRYSELLLEWQKRMNLVGSSTLSSIWTRHFADSAQLRPLLRNQESILDIGAGAGFPGLVLALLGASKVSLVEATQKKCRFLEEVISELGIGDRVAIWPGRIESLPTAYFKTITARACKSLDILFRWGVRFASTETIWVLPKGITVETELVEARKSFAFDVELVPSLTSSDARIVVATNVRCR